MAQLVKNPPAMRETWVQSLGWEDPLENGKATHSSILAWRIPWIVLILAVTKNWTRLSNFHSLLWVKARILFLTWIFNCSSTLLKNILYLLDYFVPFLYYPNFIVSLKIR